MNLHQDFKMAKQVLIENDGCLIEYKKILLNIYQHLFYHFEEG